MFLKNKYTTWYNNIITNRLASPINKEDYGEHHHIIPRSLGGTNDAKNIVKLSAREHFVCHLLLTKMVKTEYHRQKMEYAAFGMAIMNDVKVNSKIYEILKFKHSKRMMENNPVFIPGVRQKISDTLKSKPPRDSGVYTHSNETRAKISEATKGREPWNKGKSYIGGGMTGLQHSDATKQKISKSRKGQPLTENQKEKISTALTGITRSEETKQKMRESKLGIVHPRKTCKVCNKNVSVAMYARWHGDNCKANQNDLCGK